MAVPTISAVSPATGKTRGRTWVLITGTDFAVRTVGEGTIPKVQVTFGGELATDVREESSTRVTCLTPAGDAGAVDVVLQNLDALGVPVAGETVTESDGFTYARPDLTVRTRFQAVMERVLAMLARDVLANAVWDTDTDYDDATGDARNLAQHAKLPVVVLDGPRLMHDDPAYGGEEFQTLQDSESAPTSYEKRRPPAFADLEIELTVGARGKAEAMALVTETRRTLLYLPALVVEADPSDPDGAVVGYDIDLTEDFDLSRSRPNPSNVVSATATFVVRGVPFDDGETLEQSKVLQAGDTTDVIVTVTQQT